MSFSGKKELLTRIGMIGFIFIIFTFVAGSSLIYFTNSSNVEIKIKTDNQVNKEKTAVNEALTRTLVMKNDSIDGYRNTIKKNDSLFTNRITVVEKKLKKTENEKDSLIRIIRSFKQSDIQPVNRDNN